MEPLIDDMARELRPWLDLPYAVFGHSMGALLGFEWIRRLRRERHPMPAWLFLSGRRAPDLLGNAKCLHSLPDREFIIELTRLYNGIPDDFLMNAELADVFLPILRADIALVENYRFREEDPLDCPITVFAGREDTSVTWDELLAWTRQTQRKFTMQIFPGSHFYPHRPLLQSLSSTLSELHI
jgi:medium-chain acyl-[acyl-carrier-protein] hydrolase